MRSQFLSVAQTCWSLLWFFQHLAVSFVKSCFREHLRIMRYTCPKPESELQRSYALLLSNRSETRMRLQARNATEILMPGLEF